MSLQFRFAQADEYPKISDFLHRFWAENHVYCRNRDLFEWTFRRADLWTHDGYSVAVAEDGGELAGILGGIPFRFNQFGAGSQGIWIVNYVIRPDHRKGSAALQLLSQFRRPEFCPVIAFGINPATAVIYRVLRGTVLDEIPRHFLVLPHAVERMHTLLRIAHPDWDEARVRNLAEGMALCRPIPQAPESANVIPAKWDEVDWPAISRQTAGAARDSAYLTWRYRRHPVFEYRFVTVPEGARHGLAVWRLETIRRRTGEDRTDLDRIARLVEFLPVSVTNAEALFGAFLRETQDAGAMGADYYGYHSRTRCWLRQAGFREAAEHPDGRAIPTRFQPLDGKGGGILSAMFAKQDMPACADSADCAWYWTRSDSDQDRPN
jgi:hypothetical protein